jgi:hypothetical protein
VVEIRFIALMIEDAWMVFYGKNIFTRSKVSAF